VTQKCAALLFGNSQGFKLDSTDIAIDGLHDYQYQHVQLSGKAMKNRSKLVTVRIINFASSMVRN